MGIFTDIVNRPVRVAPVQPVGDRPRLTRDHDDQTEQRRRWPGDADVYPQSLEPGVGELLDVFAGDER